MYDNELIHYGVKGMKWGVRRYQNADGSMTAKGQKRYNKAVAYRDKLANKAKKRADYLTSEADQAESNVKDLKKYGKNSETYLRWKKQQYDEREAEYEENNKIETEDGNTYVKKIRQIKY